MKDFLLKNRVAIILSVVLIGFLLFYVWRFHGGLSSDQLHWSQFGDFFNGVVSPIFAAINIYIFWSLTKVIEDKNDERHRENIKQEKAIMLMQFRKEEIDRFDDIISNAYLPDTHDRLETIRTMGYASNYLITFYFTKLNLFDLNQESITARNIVILRDTIRECTQEYCDNNDIPQPVLINFLRLKDSIISDLRQITLA